mgnify:CR=1 FL=1
MTRTYAPNGRAGHRLTPPNRRKSPTERQTKAGTARSGGLIVETPCCAGSDGGRMKNAPGSQRHRQYIAPIKKRKRQTATQAIEPPALRRKGRTDEAHNIQAIWPGPSCAQPGRSRAGCRSTSLTRQGCARSHWAEQPSDQPLQAAATRLAALAPVTSSRDRSNKRTAPLDLHRPLEYAKRCHGRILPWDENDPLPKRVPYRSDS